MLIHLLIVLICFSVYTNAATKKYIIKYKSNRSQKDPTDNILNSSLTFFGMNRLTKPAKLNFRFSPSVFDGVAGEFDEEFIKMYAFANRKDIEYIEEDLEVKALALSTQSNPPWGLKRISQLTKSGPDYTYDSRAGVGVAVYVIDTGIDIVNPDFEGRAKSGTSFITGKDSNDENGHGTHCAGIIGGKLYGVAKNANLVAVRVLDANGSGSTSGVIAGINWAVQNCRGKCVISMSLGGGYSNALNTAVDNAYKAGIVSVVAAGNSNANACNYSPSSTATAITVGATDSTDARASYSNYGSCVDLYAPGSSITSDWLLNKTNTISGTSMATPHVAGIAALVLSAKSISAPQLLKEVVNMATTIKVKVPTSAKLVGVKLAQNKLLP